MEAHEDPTRRARDRRIRSDRSRRDGSLSGGFRDVRRTTPLGASVLSRGCHAGSARPVTRFLSAHGGIVPGGWSLCLTEAVCCRGTRVSGSESGEWSALSAVEASDAIARYSPVIA